MWVLHVGAEIGKGVGEKGGNEEIKKTRYGPLNTRIPCNTAHIYCNGMEESTNDRD
jgi:hypothetical protein